MGLFRAITNAPNDMSDLEQTTKSDGRTQKTNLVAMVIKAKDSEFDSRESSKFYCHHMLHGCRKISQVARSRDRLNVNDMSHIKYTAKSD